MNAAVLTVSDRVSRGTAEDASGDALEELLRADGYDVARRVVPDELAADRRRDRGARRGRGGRADDGGHRSRAARRDARGDPHGALARRARDRRGTARGLDRTHAARPALARRRRRGRTHARRQPARARPGGCRDGYAVLRPALAHALSLLADDADRAPAVVTMRAAQLYYRLVKFEHTIFALPFAYVGAFLAVSGVPVRARPALDHRRDGRCAFARDGAEPPDRRGHRRRQPADGVARAPVGRAQRRSRGRVLRRVARRLPRRRLAARPARALALAGAGARRSSSTRT